MNENEYIVISIGDIFQDLAPVEEESNSKIKVNYYGYLSITYKDSISNENAAMFLEAIGNILEEPLLINI